MWTYHNPVSIRFGDGALATIDELIDSRPYGLVTYDEPYFWDLSERITQLAGPPVVTIHRITPNPDFSVLTAACSDFAEASVQVIVAVGGGSVLDAAKILAASSGDFKRIRRFLETGRGAEGLGSIPIVAVPTTAGTGSEVTCWATAWDTEQGKKYSLARPNLYPQYALVDPELTLDMPCELTISTALDALSHSLESLWNRNANPVSANHAVFAAQEILQCLPALVENLSDKALRTRMARAALCAGLAFSNTKTALAHSLSYGITLRHGVPHGLACSFSLPRIMRSVIGIDSQCDASLARIFGMDLNAGADHLAAFLQRLGVAEGPAKYGVTEDEFRELLDAAFAGERGQNFIGTRERFLGVSRH